MNAALAVAISLGLSHASLDAKPVTEAEARAVFAVVQQGMAAALQTQRGALGAIPAAGAPVARAEVVDELLRLSKLYEGAYKLAPRRKKVEAAAIKLPAKQRAEAVLLVGAGFAAPVGPLVTGPGETLTPDQFADAVGYFVSAWAYRTHLPSIKNSPELQRTDPPARAGR